MICLENACRRIQIIACEWSDFAVKPVTNKIYVANSQSNNVTVINGAHDERQVPRRMRDLIGQTTAEPK
jgi:DNA-binding beta-propeller fold protein YncE